MDWSTHILQSYIQKDPTNQPNAQAKTSLFISDGKREPTLNVKTGKKRKEKKKPTTPPPTWKLVNEENGSSIFIPSFLYESWCK